MRSRRPLSLLLAFAVIAAGCVGTVPTGGDAPTTDTTTTGTSSTSTTHTTTTGTSSASTTHTTTTGTTTTTPLPPGRVDFPEGPKERPARPPTLNASVVREYVGTHEYRYAYNSLWVNEYTEVTLDCRVDDVAERRWGYEAVVTCTGHSNTNVPENATVTPGPHADWFTQSYRYLVSEDATHRRDVEHRDPVSRARSAGTSGRLPVRGSFRRIGPAEHARPFGPSGPNTRVGVYTGQTG